jgi:poly(hydroxyalkanoate) depolymerase family esterase
MGRFAIGFAMAVLAWAPAGALATPDPPDPGQTTTGSVISNGDQYPYILYTPTTYVAARTAPLLVMVHGCQTTAETELKVTRFDALAERAGFVVVYPDVDGLGRAQPGPANQCWKFPYPPAWSRDGSDAAAIADVTRAVMAARNIDPERVYIVGVSAGGLMAAIDAAAYPDIYAAVGLVETAGYVDWPCFTTGVGIPVQTSAQLAFDQMGPRARVVPVFVMTSDGDQAFPPSCGAKALEQGLRTDNLVLGAGQDGPIALTPAAVREEQKPGGYGYAVKTYRDPSGCLIGERWLVHGMNHFWSGGTTDPRYASFTDPKGPSGAEATWAFLERYRRSDTAMPCAEAPAPRPTCPARTVTVTLARGPRIRSVVASVAGRRVSTTIHGRRVTIRLPSGPRGAVRVALRVRREGRSGARVMHRTFRRCASSPPARSA